VVDALQGLARRGTAVDVVPGNRDFLLDAKFERASGARVRHDGLIGETERGTRVLFLHGDELSTLDRGHMRLRRFLRSRGLRFVALHLLPRSLALALARRLRRASRSAVAAKPMAHMALQPSACLEHARAHDASVVVCGHAHVFQDVSLPEGPRWLVVDAFGGERDTLEVGDDPELAPRAPG
jgi:UDP-2,3-diacylglucosamine hydrolase